jgi:hypothetical protein
MPKPVAPPLWLSGGKLPPKTNYNNRDRGRVATKVGREAAAEAAAADAAGARTDTLESDSQYRCVANYALLIKSFNCAVDYGQKKSKFFFLGVFLRSI